MNFEHSGSLDVAHSKKSIPIPFTVETDLEWIEIVFSYRPVEVEGSVWPNQISFSLFDPTRCRGTRHNNKSQRAFLSADTASPGFVSGKVSAGQWTIFLDVHRIVSPVTYTVSITSRSEPRWVRGNLHAHTLHSDGKWDINDLVQYALDEGHDFVGLTNHNTTSGLEALGTIAAGRIIPVCGSEITTTAGHALALGTRNYYEWRIGTDAAPDMRTVCQRVTDDGGFFVIAHPFIPRDPVCTGCNWDYPEMMPGNARLVEVWNEEWNEYNEQALQTVYQWLNEGKRIAMTAGLDIHDDLRKHALEGQRYGLTVAHVDSMTEHAILTAIAEGRSYLSCGPVLIITGSCNREGEKWYGSGDTMIGSDGAFIHVRIEETEPGDYLRIIQNGKEFHRQTAPANGIVTIQAEVISRSWYVAEIRDLSDNVKAVTNALFVTKQ